MTDNFDESSLPYLAIPLAEAPESHPYPVPTLDLPRTRRNSQTTPPPSPVCYLYYQIQGSTSPLPSKRAFDPHDNTKGRVLARTRSPTRTAANVKRYIAQLEGIDPLRVGAIYADAESDCPIPDSTHIATLEEGGPGTTMGSPLAISIRDPESDTPGSSPGLATPPALSLVLTAPSFLEFDTPPSPPAPLPYVPSLPDDQLQPLDQPMPLPSHDSLKITTSPSQASFPQSPTSDPRWTIGKDGFGEPIESPTEALKAVSEDQPPGWLSGRLQCIGQGIFMGKLGKKHGNITLGGTVLRDGMLLWVDTRKIKYLTIRTGDKFSTYKVIIEDTREMTYLWTGDVAIDNVQTGPV